MHTENHTHWLQINLVHNRLLGICNRNCLFKCYSLHNLAAFCELHPSISIIRMCLGHLQHQSGNITAVNLMHATMTNRIHKIKHGITQTNGCQHNCHQYFIKTQFAKSTKHWTYNSAKKKIPFAFHSKCTLYVQLYLLWPV